METLAGDVYYIDFGTAKVYYQVYVNNTVICKDGKVHIPLAKFLDYLATARELGHKTGKI